MNAGGVHNTFKSNGLNEEACFLVKLVADG